MDFVLSWLSKYKEGEEKELWSIDSPVEFL